MSIYFVHFASAFLPLALYLVFFTHRQNVLFSALAVATGAIFGYFGYYISLGITHGSRTLFMIANFIICFSLVISALLLLWRAKFALCIGALLTALIAFGLSVSYFYDSKGFAIFSHALLDSGSIANFALVCLGALACLAVWASGRFALNLGVNKPAVTALGAIFSAALLLVCTAQAMLVMMKKSIIKTDAALLSFIAKTRHYSELFPYLFALIALVLSLMGLAKIYRNLRKNGLFDTKFRQSVAHNSKIKANFIIAALASAVICGITAYYQLIASRPVTIDTPIEVTPKEGIFEFDTAMLSDNKLHRFVYVTDEGKAVRFFLLNRFADRVSPVAVFDSCMICGDMGYIKRGSELICIACNVRIFLPSVGKMGGCNPIPLAYEYDDKTIRIKESDVAGGRNYFSEVREKEVADPVSGGKVINLRTKWSYAVGGKTYYFESEANRDAFKADPQKYVGDTGKAIYRIQGYQGGANDD